MCASRDNDTDAIRGKEKHKFNLRSGQINTNINKTSSHDLPFEPIKGNAETKKINVELILGARICFLED
jgi:hypothetical protein